MAVDCLDYVSYPDERDPQYLRHETKKAVRDLATQGV